MTLSPARILKGGACAALFVLALFTALPCFGATWTVANTLDDGAGSLREALGRASSGDVINITARGEIKLTRRLEVYTSVTINGPGASHLAISGGRGVPVFQISGGTVVISGVTIMRGDSGFGDIGRGQPGAGGLTIRSGRVTLSEATVTDNSGYETGGISNYGELAVTNSTISRNSGSPGGIVNFGTLSVANSTLSGNSPGGIKNYGIATLKNSILAKNQLGNCNIDPRSKYYSQGHNLSDDGTCSGFFTQIGDRNDTPAGLDSWGVKDNGGPTPTIALLPNSPAVDAIPLGPINYCTAIAVPTTLATDQRGVTRPQGSACDIGAFEVAQPPTAPFSAFSAKLFITPPASLARPGFDLDATFTLGAHSDGIQPLSEPVTLQVGTYLFNIPPGSFHEVSTGSEFLRGGEIDGVLLHVEITPLGADSYNFKAKGSWIGATFPDPVTFGITIGDDSGTAAFTPVYN